MEKKSPDAFRTISEVAEWLGVPTHVLRFWESRFAQVKPVKRAGGRRYYRPADMELLGGIRKLLHDDGMTIRGVQKLLREEGIKHVAAMSPSLDDSSMKDVTPSNVVELRGKSADGDAPAAIEEAVEVSTEKVSEEPAAAPVSAEPTSQPPSGPEVTVAAEPTPAPAPPLPEQDWEPAVTASPTVEPTPEPDEPPVALEAATKADVQDTPSFEPELEVAATGEAASTMTPSQSGFDFGELAAQEDPPQDDVVESPETVEFHAHGADFTPPPAVEPSASTEADPTPIAVEDPVEDYEDPAELPRLGAEDLPLTARGPERPGDTFAADQEAPAPSAPTVESAPEPRAPTTPDLPDQSDPEPVTAADPTPEPAPPTTEDAPEAAPAEVDAGLLTDTPADMAPVAPATRPAPPAPAATPMDISHIPADPAEEDISPAGPSLAARMRRLTARAPQGSPAQMRALGDRLQELSGRMKRDAPHRGMQ